MAGIIFFVFLLGTLLVYNVHKKTDSGFLIIRGLDNKMQVYLNEKKLTYKKRQELPADKTYRLKIQKKDYKDYKSTFYLDIDETKVITLSLKLEAPIVGDLSVRSIPPGATVYLNNIEWKKKTPVIIRNLNADQEHTLGLYIEKYQFSTQRVQIEAGGELKIVHKFQKNFAYLSITSNPIGSEIYVDGKLMGKTPFQSHNMAPDKEFKIRVKNGSIDKEVSVTLSPGEEKKLNFDLSE